MWKRFGLLVCCAFLGLFGISENANAYNIDSADYYSWSTTSSRVYTLDPDYWALNEADGQGGIARHGSFSGGGLNYLHLCPSGTIPANSIMTFTITARLSGKYATVPLTSSDSRVGILNASYGEYGVSTYSFYSDSNISDCIDFGVGKNYEGSTLYWNGAVSFYVSRMSGVVISDSGGSGSGGSYNSVLNDIKYLNQDQYNRLVDILSNLSALRNGQITSSQIEDAVEQAQESEKDQIQDASDDAQDAADEAQDTVESDTATITQQIGNIIGAITDTPATDCEINGNMGNVNLGTMNMCQGMPQEIRTRIGYITSGVLALAILRLAYSLVQAYVAYITSFTGGNDTQNGV